MIIAGILALALVGQAQAAPAATAVESIEGFWEGAVIRDGAVRVMRLDIYRDGTALKGRTEMADFPTRVFPDAAVEQNGAAVTIRAGEDTTTLTFDPAGDEMIGVSIDALPPVRVHLKRALRPERPAVRSEDVMFRNGAVTLAGSLVTPARPGPHPAVVWIHGRGGGTREDYIGWARILAERGVASLIFDSRGEGRSTGDPARSGMADYVGDTIAAVSLLATRPEVDARQIGLRGHSAGGWIAAQAAATSKTPVAFVMTSSGPAESVRDQQIHVARHLMRQSGVAFSDAEYREAEAHEALVQDVAYTGKGWDELRRSVDRARPQRWARFVDLPESDDYEDIQWVRRNQYDPGPDLRRIKVPFLAIYGERDYVVPPEENVEKLRAYLGEAGNSDVTVVVVARAGHSLSAPGELRRLPGQRVENYYWLWPKVPAEVVQTTVDWLLARVRVAK